MHLLRFPQMWLTLLSTFLVAGQASNAQIHVCTCSDESPDLALHLVQEQEDEESMHAGLQEPGVLWRDRVLTVRFLDGTPDLQRDVINIAREWEQYCGIRFDFGNHNPAMIRISFATPGEWWSHLGSKASKKQNERTMNLGFVAPMDNRTFRMFVLHEFGHALGLTHEHLSPRANINWNKPNVYQDCARFTPPWDRETVDHNIFRTVQVDEVTRYDPKSIMHYSIPAHWTTDGVSVDDNFELSDCDKAFIRNMYPTANGVTSYWTLAGMSIHQGGWIIGDYNGDGRSDIMRYQKLSGGGKQFASQVFLSDGSMFKSAGVWTNKEVNWKEGGWHVGDFNGDEKDDLLRYVPNKGSEVLLAKNRAFLSSGIWTPAGLRFGKAGGGWSIGDFNGDGKDDLMRYMHENKSVDVFLSNGSAFPGKKTWLTSDVNFDHGGWIVGDFNGDSRDDLARYVGGKGTEVYLSHGNSFKSAGIWTPAGVDFTRGGWKVGDYDGDGTDDIFRYKKDQGSDVFLSNKTSFPGGKIWTKEIPIFRFGGWFVGDFDGNRKSDIFCYRPGLAGADVFLSYGKSFSNGLPRCD